MRPAPIATQVVQRDIHAEFQLAMALVGASIERWAVEFRHLQRTEVLEAEEPFTKGQKGSSAMPHKRNPITWERLTGLARVLRGNAMASLENVALWHERDISHSSVERIIFPDSCTLLDYMFGLLTRLMDGIVVYPANMKKNLGLSLGMWNSQTVLLALIKKGLTREAAYKLVPGRRDENLGSQTRRPRRRGFCGSNSRPTPTWQSISRKANSKRSARWISTSRK
ncbi:MAG: lyase family protein [Verrucomicrobiota bacterium]